jgi:hypothetical protein
MIFSERRLRFSSGVLCAGSAGVYFAHGVEIEVNAEAGLARVRAVDASGRPLPFTVLVDSRHLAHLRAVAAGRESEAVLLVEGGTSVTGIDETGHLALRVQTSLEIECDALGVLVLAPGPGIPWTIGIPADAVAPFLSALAGCAAGASTAVA